MRRFLVDRDVYQDPSPAVDLSMIAHFEYVASRPRLAWIVMTVADADFWTRSSLASTSAGRGHDLLRQRPPMTVFARDTREPSPSSTRCGRPGTCVDRRRCPTDFDGAVRDALRDLDRAATLQTSPLLTLAGSRTRRRSRTHCERC